MSATAVRLTLPAQPQFVSVARLTLAALAGRLGFDVEAAEDIKLAVAEAMTLLLRHGGEAATIDLEAAWSAAELEIELQAADGPGGAIAADDEEAAIAEMVMAEFMDQAEVEPAAGGGVRVRLRKRRPSA
jgi:serine/threonine-protein kinase RsbW